MRFVMSRESFYIVYDGPALANSEMDAKILAPALLSLSEAIEEASFVLNGGKAKAQLKVNASFKSGCFGIELSMLVSFWDKTKEIFSSLSLEDAKSVLEWIGLLSGTAISVFEFIKWVNKRKITKIECSVYETDSCKVYIDEDCIEVERKVIELYRNIKFREALEGVLKPLKHEGIDEFAVTNDAQSEKFTVIRKEEADKFKITEEAELLAENEYEMNLQIVGLSFMENNKWRFSDGAGSFNALIEDEEFIENINSGDISFSKGDVISALVRQIQKIEKGKIKSEYQIIKVHKIIPAFQQVKLPFEE